MITRQIKITTGSLTRYVEIEVLPAFETPRLRVHDGQSFIGVNISIQDLYSVVLSLGKIVEQHSKVTYHLTAGGTTIKTYRTYLNGVYFELGGIGVVLDTEDSQRLLNSLAGVYAIMGGFDDV